MENDAAGRFGSAWVEDGQDGAMPRRPDPDPRTVRHGQVGGRAGQSAGGTVVARRERGVVVPLERLQAPGQQQQNADKKRRQARP